MLQRIAIDDLTPGMYVNRVLDETGKVKVRSKGVVRSDTVITQLRSKGVEFVEIDTDKGKATAAVSLPHPSLFIGGLLPPSLPPFPPSLPAHLGDVDPRGAKRGDGGCTVV